MLRTRDRGVVLWAINYLTSGNIAVIKRYDQVSINYRSNGLPRKKPYIIEVIEVRLNSGKLSKIVFGKANLKPYMDIDDKVKRDVGSQII